MKNSDNYAGAYTSDPPPFNPLEPFKASEFDKLPAFPLMVLPNTLQNFVAATADSLEVVDDMVATSTLAVCALCVQKKFEIEPKPGWREPLNLYCCTIARPSERKTPALTAVMEPVIEFEREKNIELRPLIDEQDMNVSIINGQIENAKKAVIKAVKDSEREKARDNLSDLMTRKQTLEEHKAKPLQLFCGDATPEALVDLLSKNGGQMAMISDEAGVLDTALGARYSDRANLDAILNAYSGSPIRINRKTREAEIIDHPCLTIAVMIQPVALQNIVENKELLGRGLPTRFLFSFPKSKVGRRKYNTLPPPPDVISEYRELLRGLLSLEDDNGNPRIIHLSAQARKMSEAFHDALEKRLIDDLEPIEGWAGKLHGKVMRIAGILHLCKYCDQADKIPLEESVMAAAEEIGNYYLQHAVVAFSAAGKAEAPEEKAAKYILAKLTDAGKASISKRDLLRKCRRFKSDDKEIFYAGLNILTERGYIGVMESDGKHRHSFEVFINPLYQSEIKGA